MSTIALLGVTGVTGGLVAAEAARRGHDLVVGARDVDAARARLDELGVEAELHRVDVTQPGGLAPLLSAAPVLVTTVGPFVELGRPVAEAAASAGVGYVDTTGEQPFLRWLDAELAASAAAAGARMVPAAGVDYLPGDLLSARAGASVGLPRDVHVAYGLPRRADLLFGTTRGTRTSAGGVLDAPALALVDGRRVEERPGEARRLAWFPRPVGPHHAAAIGGGEVLSVPRHLPSVRTVRTYLALPSLVAEGMQALAGAASVGAVGRALARGLLLPPEPSPTRRAEVRWACLAEVAGAEDEVARAWAYGTDLYTTTAVTSVVVAERLALGTDADGAELPVGVLSPAQLGDPGALLDTIADRSDLRWSVARPDAS
ncbi:MAG: saccharopine dehydrogenase NADP-binding domain-containing protein [Actinomycetes bacterium]